MKKLFPLFLLALFLSWSLTYGELTPTQSSQDVSYMTGVSTSNVAPWNEEEFEVYVVDEGTADVAPLIFTGGGQLPVITDFSDSIFVFWPESTTADNGCLGVEFDGTNFWVTGRNASGGDVHKIHKFDSSGNLIASYDQGTASVWGWRDLAWDGAYLYASDSDTLVQIDISSGSPIPTGVGIPGPQNPNRGLAYDPATDHFWTANFGSSIYEFDRNGNIINTYANTKAIYGLAWDDVSPDGPWLWVNSQDGTPQMQISQFDPSTGTYTGASFQGDLPGATTAALAGGACFTDEWDPTIEALFVLGQGTPTDFVYGYDMYPISQVLGACCDDVTGICADSVEESQCPSPNRWEANTLCADLQPPCVPIPPCSVFCPVNGIPEGEEDCYDDWVDTTNTGCNATPPAPYVYTAINLGDTICGTAGTFLYQGANYRDTDWYRLVLTTDATLIYTGVAEFPLHMFLIDAGSEDCLDFSILTDGGADPCSMLTLSAPATAGVYWLWAGPEVFTGVPCGSDYWITVDTAAAPTGACCVNDQCVATNTQSECDALQGDWYVGETCPDFQCPVPPRDCNDPDVIYTNGDQVTFISAYNVAQCDIAYPFQFATADDFELTGSDSVDITSIVTWTWHWNGNVSGPDQYDALNVVIYENDDVSFPGTNMPAGEPVDGDPDCSHIENIPNGIVYMTTLTPGSFSFVLVEPTEIVYRLEIPVSVRLAPNQKYWLEVQPEMQFGLAGQVATRNSTLQTGDVCMRFAPLFGYDPWTTQPDSADMAFCLVSSTGGGGCDYVVGDVNGSDNYNGLDITYGVAFFKGGPAPLCDPNCPPCAGWHYCGDVNASCNYNGLDITYGVAFFKGGPGPQPCADCPPNP